MAEGRVATYLAEARERSERPVSHVTSLPVSHDGVRGLMESAADVPRLLAAVEAVLAIHHEEAGKCARCRGAWPCGEYLEISAALLGEEKADG